jgi:hypothetical protein
MPDASTNSATAADADRFDSYARKLAGEIADMLREHSAEDARTILAMAHAILSLEPAPHPSASSGEGERQMHPAPPEGGYTTR